MRIIKYCLPHRRQLRNCYNCFMFALPQLTPCFFLNIDTFNLKDNHLQKTFKKLYLLSFYIL